MVSEEEYREAMGMGLEDLKRAVYDKLGSAEAAMEAMDVNKDGVISKDEFINELKKAGFGEKEAADMFDELAGEDGKLTAEDWAEATGAEDLAEQREAAGVGDEEAVPGRTPTVMASSLRRSTSRPRRRRGCRKRRRK